MRRVRGIRIVVTAVILVWLLLLVTAGVAAIIVVIRVVVSEIVNTVVGADQTVAKRILTFCTSTDRRRLGLCLGLCLVERRDQSLTAGGRIAARIGR